MAVLPPPQIDPKCSTGLRALSYSVGDAAVIVVEGWLDGPGIPALERAFEEAFNHGHFDLVLDLHQLRRVDPIALDMLRTALQTAIRRGGTLSTAGLRPSLEDAVYPLISRGLRLHEMVSDALPASLDRTDARQ